MYLEDITLTQEEFYQRLQDDSDISTSQPSPADVMAFWDEILEEYDELVYIPMSSGLSSSLETAAMLAQDYDGRVQVVNNQRISVTQRQSTIDACYLAKTGKSALQIKEILEADKFESSIYIMVDTLKYLKKGGRVTAAGAAIGAVLRIKPVLQIQGEKLDAFAKARGTKLGKKIMLDAMQADITERFAGKKMQLALAYTCSESEALEWKHEIEARFPDYEIVADRLSLSVACHIGPGALAIACAIDESQVEH
jgi:DegV family protein with EDD domain